MKTRHFQKERGKREERQVQTERNEGVTNDKIEMKVKDHFHTYLESSFLGEKETRVERYGPR